MSAYKLLITNDAVFDALDATNYYRSVQLGLEDRFLAELKDAYTKISENLQYYGFISSKGRKRFRKIKLNKFPFVVIFNIVDNTVTVVSVFNTKQNPKFK